MLPRHPEPRAGRRRIVRRATAVVATLLGIAAIAAPALAEGDHITRLRLTGIIDQVNASFVREAIAAADEGGAAAVLIEIDTPGGDLKSTDEIVSAILNSPIPVITYVAPDGARAGSAGTFITLAGDVAAMAPSTNIGAASVVGSGGQELDPTLAAKVTNDAVAKIRALAETHDRNADWAESAVREAASVNASDAIEMDPPVVDLVAADVDALLAAIDTGRRADGATLAFEGRPLPALAELPLSEVRMNIGQSLLHLLSDPNVVFILFTIGFYGLLAEVWHPNFFSGIAGAIAILLAFIGSNSLPLNVGGLLLILLGIGLFVLELQVPSYGLLTVGGTTAFVLGAFALYTRVDGTDSIQVTVSPWLIVAAVAVTLVYFWVLVRALLQMRAGRSATDPMAALMGALGTAQTILAPTGIAYAGGESWSARTGSGTITAGTPIRVVGVQGLELIVEPADAPERGEEERQ
ncbi:MAG TPA: NfeD family protein [Candidatus Limnocylindria bacterium]|nr:NfeD family protein [Candidatus Limnocylindria bacterium]